MVIVAESVFIGADGSTGTYFVDPADAAIAPAGDLVVVVDQRLPGVVGVSFDGNEVFTVVGRGQGPGEWQQPRMVAWVDSGFSVWDAQRDRVVRLDRSGAILGTRFIRRSQVGYTLFMGGHP